MKKVIKTSEIATLVWSKLKYTPCIIDGNQTTVIEIKEVWELIRDLEELPSINQGALEHNVKINIDLIKENHRLIADIRGLKSTEPARIPK